MLKSGGRRQWTDEHLHHHDFIELGIRSQERIFEKCSPLYKEGQSLREIEEKTGIAKSTIRKALKEKGLSLRNPITASGKKFKSKRGKHSGGVPYGWDCLDGELVLEPKEQKIIRQILKLHHAGTSNNAIAKHLNDKKVPTRLNGKWRDSTIKLIIQRNKNIK